VAGEDRGQHPEAAAQLGHGPGRAHGVEVRITDALVGRVRSDEPPVVVAGRRREVPVGVGEAVPVDPGVHGRRHRRGDLGLPARDEIGERPRGATAARRPDGAGQADVEGAGVGRPVGRRAGGDGGPGKTASTVRTARARPDPAASTSAAAVTVGRADTEAGGTRRATGRAGTATGGEERDPPAGRATPAAATPTTRGTAATTTHRPRLRRSPPPRRSIAVPPLRRVWPSHGPTPPGPEDLGPGGSRPRRAGRQSARSVRQAGPADADELAHEGRPTGDLVGDGGGEVPPGRSGQPRRRVGRRQCL
jgi:hypothetical protein